MRLPRLLSAVHSFRRRADLAKTRQRPIRSLIAFFLRSSAGGETTGFYPSPAGATECRLDLDAWGRIAAEHPLLAAAEPDVEAILISRGERDQPGVETFLVPIDACYELAGRMRLLWRGFDGGAEARQSITAFLERVRERSRDLGEGP